MKIRNVPEDSVIFHGQQLISADCHGPWGRGYESQQHVRLKCNPMILNNFNDFVNQIEIA